jgi:hypothetical protein
LREELAVPRRCGILNVGEKGIEAVAIAQLEPDDDPMAVVRVRPAVIRRDGEKRRAGARLPDIGRSGAGGRDDDADDSDDVAQSPPRDRPPHAAMAHPFRDSGRSGPGSSNPAVELRGTRRHGECRGERAASAGVGCWPKAQARPWPVANQSTGKRRHGITRSSPASGADRRRA